MNPDRNLRVRGAGFTLIELMIAVAIVGLLLAVAFPSYQEYIRRGNRAAAQSFMTAVAQKEEQYLLDARMYASVASNAGFSALGLAVPAEVSKYYDLTVAPVGGDTRTYLIQAVPISGTAQTSDGTLTLNNSGTKTPSAKW